MNETKEQTCWICKTPKPLTSEYYYKDSCQKKGFQKACKECQKARNLKYHAEHREYFKQKGKEKYKKEDNPARYQKTKANFLKRKDEWYKSIRGRLYDLLSSARDRAKKRNLPIDIDLEFLLELYEKQNKLCAITGMEFELKRTESKKERYTPFGPSIDKIDHTKGYTKDNVRLVCVMVNLSLNTFGDECFDKMCEAYIKKKKQLVTPSLFIS